MRRNTRIGAGVDTQNFYAIYSASCRFEYSACGHVKDSAKAWEPALAVRKRVFCFLAWKQAVAGFDRQIAGATDKFRLKRRLSDLSEAIFTVTSERLHADSCRSNLALGVARPGHPTVLGFEFQHPRVCGGLRFQTMPVSRPFDILGSGMVRRTACLFSARCPAGETLSRLRE